MEKLLQDLRFGFRQLLKKPGFAALAIISMALGIGANTSIFRLLDTVLLRPLAVKEPSQLVELYGTMHNGADFTLHRADIRGVEIAYLREGVGGFPLVLLHGWPETNGSGGATSARLRTRASR